MEGALGERKGKAPSPLYAASVAITASGMKAEWPSRRAPRGPAKGQTGRGILVLTIAHSHRQVSSNSSGPNAGYGRPATLKDIADFIYEIVPCIYEFRFLHSP